MVFYAGIHSVAVEKSFKIGTRKVGLWFRAPCAWHGLSQGLRLFGDFPTTLPSHWKGKWDLWIQHEAYQATIGFTNKLLE